MKTKNQSCSSGVSDGLRFAFVLIAVGLLLLMLKTNIIPSAYNDVIISWQILLIVLGVASWFKCHFTFGSVLFAVGAFFVIPRIGAVPDNFLGTVPPDFVKTYYPVLLIFAGVLAVLHSLFAKKDCSRWCKKARFSNEFDCNEVKKHGSQGNFNKNCAFASSRHIVLDPVFEGGETTTAFGETVVDLRKTTLPEGKTVLVVNVAFGSTELYVPADWNVQFDVNAVFGAFEDKRPLAENAVDTSKTLIIRGSVFMGGGELNN
jgi:predicted membrane protein